LKLLSRRSGSRYGLGMLGAAMRANPGVIAMVEHNAILYSDLADPIALMRPDRRPTELGKYWAYAKSAAPAELATDATTSYTALMAASQSLIAEDIIEAYPLGSHHRLLDVGGGDGTLLSAVAKHVPGLELALFDLPSVAEEARARLGSVASHTRIHGGSFFTDKLPEGADVVTLVRVLLDHDDGAALQILRNVRQAISPGGTLLVAETLSEMRGAERVSDAYFGMYLMAMGSGRPRSFATLSRLLETAGFSKPKLVKTRHPMLTSLIKTQATC
jgi:demethylspheroidene O-methyltransferase